MTETYAQHIEEFRETRREGFLDVAAEVLAEQGIRQTTMDHVAARAKISKVVLYRYFGAKDKLVHATLERIVELLLEADSKSSGWWTDRVRSTLSVARDHRAALILLVRHSAHDPEYGVHFERLHAVLVKRVEERLAEILGRRRKTPVRGTYLSQTITTFFLDAYLRWLEEGDPRKDNEFFEWVTRSVRAMSYYWGGDNPPDD